MLNLLVFQITTKSTPPPGFEFVPIGNPALTKACKELSREKDAMIFIVSARHVALYFHHSTNLSPWLRIRKRSIRNTCPTMSTEPATTYARQS